MTLHVMCGKTALTRRKLTHTHTQQPVLLLAADTFDTAPTFRGTEHFELVFSSHAQLHKGSLPKGLELPAAMFRRQTISN